MEENKIKIAIVDDHNVSLEGMKALLKCLDYIEVVIEASNGKDLIEKMEKIVPNIIFMDVKMPIMNGIEATKEISKKYPEIKIIGFSYYSDELPFIREMISAGAKGFVSKNIGFDDIDDMLTKILNGETYFSPDVSALILRSQQNIFDKTKILSTKEQEVSNLDYEGYSNKEIADKLHISKKTVENYKYKIKIKEIANKVKNKFERFLK